MTLCFLNLKLAMDIKRGETLKCYMKHPSLHNGDCRMSKEKNPEIISPHSKAVQSRQASQVEEPMTKILSPRLTVTFFSI